LPISSNFAQRKHRFHSKSVLARKRISPGRSFSSWSCYRSLFFAYCKRHLDNLNPANHLINKRTRSSGFNQYFYFDSWARNWSITESSVIQKWRRHLSGLSISNVYSIPKWWNCNCNWNCDLQAARFTRLNINEPLCFVVLLK